LSRNPFQGGMGISTGAQGVRVEPRAVCVAIPFRVGWGFPPLDDILRALGLTGRNPFQGGMGISTLGYMALRARVWDGRSQSLSGWDGDFHLLSSESICISGLPSSRNPFQGGMGISTR